MDRKRRQTESDSPNPAKTAKTANVFERKITIPTEIMVESVKGRIYSGSRDDPVDEKSSQDSDVVEIARSSNVTADRGSRYGYGKRSRQAGGKSVERSRMNWVGCEEAEDKSSASDAAGTSRESNGNKGRNLRYDNKTVKQETPFMNFFE